MHRFRILVLVSVASALSGVLVAASGCDSVTDGETAADAATQRKDSSAVDPAEAGDALGENSSGPVSCDKYCSLVMENCAGDEAQYASTDECLAFCAHLPSETAPTTNARSAASVACRQYWADSPARTDPKSSCLAAGPFGGNVCGDRCTAFCDVLLDTCAPDTADGVYGGQPDCATACTGFTYLDAGLDGGGESPTGPADGDSLNCRLFHLRGATLDADRCSELRSPGACGAGH